MLRSFGPIDLVDLLASSTLHVIEILLAAAETQPQVQNDLGSQKKPTK